MTNADPSRSEEAKNLAHEAVDAMKSGEKDVGAFLADAAKFFDKQAAAEVLKEVKSA